LLKRALLLSTKQAGKVGLYYVCLPVRIAVREDGEVEWDKTYSTEREAEGHFLSVAWTAEDKPSLLLPAGGNKGATEANEKTQIRVFEPH
jgi:hypothetical protein